VGAASLQGLTPPPTPLPSVPPPCPELPVLSMHRQPTACRDLQCCCSSLRHRDQGHRLVVQLLGGASTVGGCAELCPAEGREGHSLVPGRQT
jgi:hypothetical protein